jgi:hypothetical protein
MIRKAPSSLQDEGAEFVVPPAFTAEKPCGLVQADNGRDRLPYDEMFSSSLQKRPARETSAGMEWSEDYRFAPPTDSLGFLRFMARSGQL